MKKKIFILISFALISLLLSSCSDIQDNIDELIKPKVSIHAEGINDPASPNFHGKLIANSNKKFGECITCHAGNFEGGTAGVSCATSNCHPSISVHKGGILNPGSPAFHGKYISENFNWDMRTCGSCHGTNYAGGMASPTCLSCHTASRGPEQCNTCHGDFTDTTRIAPPRALNGSIETTYRGVGAHEEHLYDRELSNNVRCGSCHNYPSGGVYAAGHLDNTPHAEINLKGLAGTLGVYDANALTCANVYCHGNFTFYRDSAAAANRFAYTAATMTGLNKTVTWNKVGMDEAACGTCHGLPPAGHIASTLTACANCHIGVVDNTGKIIDKVKHVNGIPNVFGN